MFAGPTIPSASATRPAVLDQVPVLDRHPLDRLAALRLDHRARDRVRGSGASRSQKTSIENSSPRADLLHHRRRRSCSRGRSRARARSVGAVDVARAEPAARLDEHREARRRPGSSSGSQVGGDAIPLLLEEAVRERTCPRRAGSSRARAAARAPEPRRGARRAPGGRDRRAGRSAARRAARRARGARRCSRGRRPRDDRAPVGGVERRARARPGRPRASSRRRARTP